MSNLNLLIHDCLPHYQSTMYTRERKVQRSIKRWQKDHYKVKQEHPR